MKSASKYGISVPDGSAFDMQKMIERKDKIVKKLTGGVQMTVNSYGAVIVPHEAVITGEADGRFPGFGIGGDVRSNLPVGVYRFRHGYPAY